MKFTDYVTDIRYFLNYTCLMIECEKNLYCINQPEPILALILMEACYSQYVQTHVSHRCHICMSLIFF